MLTLDLHTFFLMIELLLGMYAVSALLVYKVRRQLMHLSMFYSVLVMLAAFLLMHSHFDNPNAWVVVGYNFLFLLSAALIIVGFRDYFKLQPLPYRYLFYLGTSVLGTVFFSVVFPDYFGRVGVTSFYMGLFVLDVMYEARLALWEEKTNVRRAVFSALGLLLGFVFVRFIGVVLFTQGETTLTQNLVASALTTGSFAVFIFTFWLTGSLLLDSERAINSISAKSEKMADLAMRDPLTKLFNRNKMEEDLSEFVERSNREGDIASILLIDVDYFKQINDRFGHDIGDAVLLQAAQTFTELLRADDRVYRWGGDEFMILAQHTDINGAARLAKRLAETFDKIDFPTVGKITLSIGCAQHFQYETKTDWFKRVDLALYKAKQSGRNRVELWNNDDMLAASITKLVWTEAFVSGQSEIDRQHRNLIRLSNELYDALGSSDSGANLEEILNRVAKELIEHFTYEADLMDKTGFSEANTHRKTHDRLLAEFASMRDELHLGRVNLGAFFNFVSVRIVAEHIIKEDTKFFAHMKTLKP